MNGIRHGSRRYCGDVEAALAFHADVEQRQVGPVLAREQDRVVAVVGVDDLVAGLRQAVASGSRAPGGRRRRPGSLPLFATLRCLLRRRRYAGGRARSYAASTRVTTRRPQARRWRRRRRSRLLDAQGGAAPRQQRPHQAEAGHAAGIRARLEARRQLGPVADGDAHAAGLALEGAVDAIVAVAVGAVLDGVGEQLVERQRDRDRLGLGQAPVGRARPVDAAVDRRGRRCAAPSWRSPRARRTIGSGPVAPTCRP